MWHSPCACVGMPAEAQDASHRCAVLLIEDDADVREMIRIALAQSGYDVATASNGRDALHHLRSTPSTCVIILDLMLPMMGGEEFRRAQLHDRSLAWIPVIVLSGTMAGQQKARELNAQAFLRKPLDIDTLREKIHEIGCVRTGARLDDSSESTCEARLTSDSPGLRPSLRRSNDAH